MSWPSWAESTELIKTLALLAWPTVIIIIFLRFRRGIDRLLERLRKAKVFGQEIELDELDRTTRGIAEKAAVAPLPDALPESPAGPDVQSPQPPLAQLARQVLTEAANSPKAALMLLAADMEIELRALAEQMGSAVAATVRPRSTFRDSLETLRELGVPEDLLRSMVQFRDVRNRLVHGYEADDTEILRAIDIGLRLLTALRVLRRRAKAQRDTRILASAVSIYSAHMGRLPPGLADLTRPAANAEGKTLGPILHEIPAPPEGWSPYLYTPNEDGHFTVTTTADGETITLP